MIADYAALDDRERAAVDRYYTETIFPVLTPLAFDPGRPFPHISNLSLNLAIVLHDPHRTDEAGQQAFRPRESSRSSCRNWWWFRRLRLRAGRPMPRAIRKFVWIEQVIAANLKSLFPGPRDCGIASVPRHARRGSGHPGARERRSSGDPWKRRCGGGASANPCGCRRIPAISDRHPRNSDGESRDQAPRK